MAAVGVRTRVRKPEASCASRFAWTVDVHRVFESGLGEHGANNPALVRDHMTRHGIAVSRDQVKSHLQKHRADENRMLLAGAQRQSQSNAHLWNNVKAWNLHRVLCLNGAFIARMALQQLQPQPQQS